MAQANFDIAGNLDLFFRSARTGSKVFTFKAGDSPYPLDGYEFEVDIKRKKTGEPVLKLTTEKGLIVDDNTITIEVDEEQTDLPGDFYYWELYEATGKKTWIWGYAFFTTGFPSGTTSETPDVTVNMYPDIVTISITNPGGDLPEDIDGGIL
jgi:hypothetical protein